MPECVGGWGEEIERENERVGEHGEGEKKRGRGWGEEWGEEGREKSKAGVMKRRRREGCGEGKRE